MSDRTHTRVGQCESIAVTTEPALLRTVELTHTRGVVLHSAGFTPSWRVAGRGGNGQPVGEDGSSG